MIEAEGRTMSYQYDAFFSYKRDRESDQWHEVVKTKLEFWLRQELQKLNVRIFFDTEEIRTGMRWRQKLSDSLKKSRCIVCFWSPLYFQSKWCVSRNNSNRGQVVIYDLLITNQDLTPITHTLTHQPSERSAINAQQ
jgi:hypothetical protein